MNRTRLFKGFHPDKNGTTTITLDGKKIKGEWVYGNFYEAKISGCFILVPKVKTSKKDGVVIKDYFDVFEVLPETVCQFTGLTDVNGVKIFDNDIVESENDIDSDSGIGAVIWLNDFGCWYVDDVNNGLGDLVRSGFVTVIGNIYENDYATTHD